MKRAASNDGGDDKRAKLAEASRDYDEKLTAFEQAMAAYDVAVAQPVPERDDEAVSEARHEYRLAFQAAVGAHERLREQTELCRPVPTLFHVNHEPFPDCDQAAVHKGPDALLAMVREILEKQGMVPDRIREHIPLNAHRIAGPDAETYAKLIRLWTYIVADRVNRSMYKADDVNVRFLGRLVHEYEMWCYLRYNEGADYGSGVDKVGALDYLRTLYKK